MKADKDTIGQEKSSTKWIKRFGVAGFMFFLIKGLLWLLAFAGITYFAW